MQIIDKTIISVAEPGSTRVLWVTPTDNDYEELKVFIDGRWKPIGGSSNPQSHPDISTQPSLLPQKFGNYDMYERLIPISDLVLEGDDLIYPAVYEEKGMIVTSCFLLSNDLTMAGIATITRDYFEDGDEILGDKILFSCCDPNYNISWFDYILVQYYIPTNPAYYYDEPSEDSDGQS